MSLVHKTKKILILCIILNLLIWAAFAFFFLKIRTQTNRISDLTSEVGVDIDRDKNLRTTKAMLDENEVAISQLDSYFVKSDGVVDFINSLESMGNKNGVSINISSVSVESDVKAKATLYETLRLKIEISGTWANVTNFIAILENLPYGVNISQVSLVSVPSALSDSGKGSVSWRGAVDFGVLKLK